MLSKLTAWWRARPREPLAGVALAAMTGIGAAEGWRAAFVRGLGDAGAAPWVAAGLFAALLAAWGAGGCRRWRTFLGLVAAGYAALHLFGSDPLPALGLARRLAQPATVFLEEPGAGFHRLRGVGTVADAPRASDTPAGRTWRFLLALNAPAVDADAAPACPGTVRVAAEWRNGPPALAAGDRMELRAALAANVAGPRNPGEFDEVEYLRRQGVRSAVRVSGLADARLRGPPGWGGRALLRRAHACRAWMEGRLGVDLQDDPAAGAVVATTLLGLRGPPGLGDLAGPFQRTGTLHYFAIDGLKLGLLAFLLLEALKLAGLRGAWAGAAALPLLAGYALATGLGAASARAVLVAAVLVGGQALDRPPRPLNGLGAAAALILLFDTQQLFALGFQLSFGVVLAILTLSGPLREQLLPVGAPDSFLPRRLYSGPLRAWETLRRRVVEMTSVALAAALGSAPLTFLNFHLVSPVSPLANVAVFPLAAAILALGVLSLAGSWLPGWSAWMNNANWLAAKAMLLAVRGFDQVPGGSFPLASPAHWRWQRPALDVSVNTYCNYQHILQHFSAYIATSWTQ